MNEKNEEVKKLDDEDGKQKKKTFQDKIFRGLKW